MSNETRQLFCHGDGIRGGGGRISADHGSSIDWRALGHDLMRGTAKAQAVMEQDRGNRARGLPTAWRRVCAVGVVVHVRVITDAGSGVPGRGRVDLRRSGDLGFDNP